MCLLLIITGIFFLQAVRVCGHAIYTQLGQKATPSSWNYFIWSLDLPQLPSGVERSSSVSHALDSATRRICLLPPWVWQAPWEFTRSGWVPLFVTVTHIFFMLLSYSSSFQTSLCNLCNAVSFCPFVPLEKVPGTRAFVHVSWYSGIQIHHGLCEKCLIVSQ